MDSASHQYHRCHLCHRRYKRPEHLQRHYKCHRPHRPHVCESCRRSFSRSDALKRHVRTCTAGSSDPVGSSSKRRACDRCVRVKRACDFNHPCQTCLDKNAHCTFTTLEGSDKPAFHDHTQIFGPISPAQTDGHSLSVGLFDSVAWAEVDPYLVDLASTSWNDFLSLAPTSTGHIEGHKILKLNFLDNFTKHTGLIKSFDCGTAELRQLVLEYAQQEYNPSTSVVDPLQLHRSLTSDPLATRCNEIVAFIKEVAVVKPRNSAVDIIWSDLTHDMCSQFFSPSSVRKNLELYWSIWHPNVNIIHRPTFDLVCAKAVLLAAMAVIGASVSPDDVDSRNAHILFNAVEEIVFTDDDLCDNNHILLHGLPILPKVQAMQAAYIVCLYQNWEGSDQAKRRIRRHRFGTLVSVARDIGIHNARHPEYTRPDQFDWAAFAAREQLIRVFLWTFLLDTAFVIFNNLPPRMVIKEMTLGLASCEAIFQAESSENCIVLLQGKLQTSASQISRPINVFYRAAEILCKSELNDAVIQDLADLGPLNLFAVTSSLHSMLFHYQNGFSSESQLHPMRNALENWKVVWTKYSHELADVLNHAPLGTAVLTPQNMWKRIGFMRHASEYWLLASLKLDRICIRERQSLEDDQRSEASPINIPLVSEQDDHPVLQKYDETDMQQVNDLIADFQRTTLS